ncbi:type II toxin-antitoxin system PemK/MazF family toxin [Aquisphaera insulae]|uniref:type II toxin-antitoxin system PemK/MazF family toxin n=1 Tax=Aquisphaera insulae TaxID=2712864 RepID=UPI0013E9B7F1|nr:type II toxin-antitoxin system PemK/MazF family toxin [Aquisphaera insulae]
MAAAHRPSRGEIRLVDFDPAVGAEIRKIRPALVISMDTIGRLPLRLIVPITDWKPQYMNYPWFVEIPATSENGLIKDSGADAFQTKSVSGSRFVRRLGWVNEDQLEEAAAAIAICVGPP